MKKNFKRKALGISSSLLMASGIGLTATSCNKDTNIDSLFFTVKNTSGNLEVTFCDVGASIYSIKYKDQYITYHPVDKTTFIRPDIYYGKALGRIAGRIKDGKLDFNSGKTYDLEINEKKVDDVTNKNNSLHGGKNSFSGKTFKRYVQDLDNEYKISFNYVSADGEAGYPGIVDAWYVYTIHKNDDIMDLNIYATTPYGSTPVNLTNHPYFRLGNTGTVLNHKLEVPATNMATYEKDDDNKGNQVVVDGDKTVATTPYDFNASGASANTIGSRIQAAQTDDPTSGGYDHIWRFKDDSHKYVELYNPDTKINLKVTTDADAVIMYANCFPNESMQFISGLDVKNAAITIEPYTFFTKEATSIAELVITPEKPFNREITYTLTQEEK